MVDFFVLKSYIFASIFLNLMNLAFLGLGIMGSPMALHLKNKGYNVKVWNRTENKIKKAGFEVLPLHNVVKDADFIMMCLGDDLSVNQTTNTILPFVKKGVNIIDHTTTSAELSRKLYTICKEKGVNFLDAPMTGGQLGAESGTLVMMCGGDFEVFEKSKPILQSYTSSLEYFGEIGSGQLCKMVNQIAIAGIIQSLAEAVSFADKAGIDAKKLFKIIEGGAGGSWQMKNRHELMISRDFKENFGFPAEWMLKDLNICLAEGKKLNANLESTAEIAKKYATIVKEINPRFDTSSLILLSNIALNT